MISNWVITTLFDLCDVSDRWYKMGEVVRPTGHILLETDGTLVLQNTQVVHEGEYTCVASNVGGNATFTTNLDVQGKT